MIDERHGVRLDGDAAFAFQIHIIEELIFHIAQGDRLCLFEDAVGQCTFAVVDVGNNAEIPYFVAGYRHFFDHLFFLK